MWGWRHQLQFGQIRGEGRRHSGGRNSATPPIAFRALRMRTGALEQTLECMRGTLGEDVVPPWGRVLSLSWRGEACATHSEAPDSPRQLVAVEIGGLIVRSCVSGKA